MSDEWTLEQYWQHIGGTAVDAQKQTKGKQSQRRGARGELAAESALRSAGVQMVEKITTPYVITDRKLGDWVRIKRSKKVSGDWRGVMGDGSGRRVLAEVKTTSGDRVSWSRLKKHQIEALDTNHTLGAVSLLVVVFPFGAYALHWPIPGFGPGKSITWEDARELQWGE